MWRLNHMVNHRAYLLGDKVEIKASFLCPPSPCLTSRVSLGTSDSPLTLQWLSAPGLLKSQLQWTGLEQLVSSNTPPTFYQWAWWVIFSGWFLKSVQTVGAGSLIPTCVQLRSSKSGFLLSGAQPESSILPSELPHRRGGCLVAASGHPAFRRLRQEMDHSLHTASRLAALETAVSYVWQSCLFWDATWHR